MEYIKVFAYLFIVLLVFYVVARILKNNIDSLRRSKHIEIIDSVAVSAKSNLQIAKVGSKTYLLGVTDNHINVLDEIEGELEVLNRLDGKVDFSSIIKNKMRRGDNFEKN